MWQEDEPIHIRWRERLSVNVTVGGGDYEPPNRLTVAALSRFPGLSCHLLSVSCSTSHGSYSDPRMEWEWRGQCARSPQWASRNPKPLLTLDEACAWGMRSTNGWLQPGGVATDGPHSGATGVTAQPQGMRLPGSRMSSSPVPRLSCGRLPKAP